MNKAIRSWVLYDFANSIMSVVVGFYFALYIVDTLGWSDAWVSVVSVCSTALLLATLPYFGLRADVLGLHKRYLSITTIISGISILLLGITMNINGYKDVLVAPLAICLYFIFQIFFQAAIAFYNSFLKGISVGKEERIAGIGNGFGQLGNVTGLAIGLLIVSKEVHLFSFDLISSIFIINSLVFLLIFFLIKKGFKERDSISVAQVTVTSYKDSFKKIWKHKNVFNYLIAFLLYSDSILTLNIFVSLYMRKAGELTDGQISMFGLIGLSFGILGAIITPWLNKVVGERKKALSLYVILFGVFLVLFAFCQTNTQFLACIIATGLLFGILFTASVSIYTKLIPRNQEAEYFSFYVLFSRFASLIGPPLWSLTAYSFSSWGDDRYRFSVMALAIVVFISLFFIKKVDKEALL